VDLLSKGKVQKSITFCISIVPALERLIEEKVLSLPNPTIVFQFMISSAAR
jgi:hypothetical protein